MVQSTKQRAAGNWQPRDKRDRRAVEVFYGLVAGQSALRFDPVAHLTGQCTRLCAYKNKSRDLSKFWARGFENLRDDYYRHCAKLLKN